MLKPAFASGFPCSGFQDGWIDLMLNRIKPLQAGQII